jgi:hypothetical protein
MAQRHLQGLAFQVERGHAVQQLGLARGNAGQLAEHVVGHGLGFLVEHGQEFVDAGGFGAQVRQQRGGHWRPSGSGLPWLDLGLRIEQVAHAGQQAVGDALGADLVAPGADVLADRRHPGRVEVAAAHGAGHACARARRAAPWGRRGGGARGLRGACRTSGPHPSRAFVAGAWPKGQVDRFSR